MTSVHKVMFFLAQARAASAAHINQSLGKAPFRPTDNSCSARRPIFFSLKPITFQMSLTLNEKRNA